MWLRTFRLANRFQSRLLRPRSLSFHWEFAIRPWRSTAQCQAGLPVPHNRRMLTTTKQKNPQNDQQPTIAGESKLETKNPSVQGDRSAGNRLRELWSKYGWTGIAVYATIDVVTLGAFYVAVLEGVDVVALFERIHLLEFLENLGLDENLLASKTSSFVTAYALYSAVAPIRFALTFALTPLVGNYRSRKKEENSSSEK